MEMSTWKSVKNAAEKLIKYGCTFPKNSTPRIA